MIKQQILFAMQDLENLKDLIKIEAIDHKINDQSAREYLRIIDLASDRLLKAI
jgi:hypothetical protein